MKTAEVLRVAGRKLYSLWAPFFLIDDRRFKEYQIGEYTYGTPKILSRGGGATLRIGRFCSIAEGVRIHLAGMHAVERVTTYPFDRVFKNIECSEAFCESKGDVVIGHDVWIGTEALILSGVTIGNGAVVAARSVVTKDVPPYAIVAGNPAQQIRYRFGPEHVAALERIAWWNWPIENIQEAWPFLLSSNIGDFIRRYYAGANSIPAAGAEGQ